MNKIFNANLLNYLTDRFIINPPTHHANGWNLELTSDVYVLHYRHEDVYHGVVFNLDDTEVEKKYEKLRDWCYNRKPLSDLDNI